MFLAALVFLCGTQPLARHDWGRETDCAALAQCIELFQTSHNQCRCGGIELQNCNHKKTQLRVEELWLFQDRCLFPLRRV